MNWLKKIFKDKEILMGILMFAYFFLLLLGVLVPSLRLGTSGGFSIAFIYRSIIFTVFFIGVIILFYKKYHSISYTLGIFLLIFLLTGVLAIFLPYQDKYISLSERLMSLLYLVSVIFTLFAFIEVLPSYISKKSLITLFILIDAIVLLCCLYSLITEYKEIYYAFIAKGEEAHFYQIHSLFDNKNSYGLMIFVALISNIFIYFYFRKKWLFIPFVFYLINLVISRSKTALIIVILLGIVLFFYWYFRSFKKHQVRNVLLLTLIIVILYTFALLIFVPQFYEGSKFLSSLSNYVREAFIGQGYRSIMDRLTNIYLAREIFLTPRIILGYGEHTCYAYANSCCYQLGYIDNAYIYNLLSGGIFKTALFIYIYYLIFKRITYINKDKHVSSLFKVLLPALEISLLLYGTMENYQILGSNHTSFIFLFISYSLPTLYYRLLKEKEDGTSK